MNTFRIIIPVLILTGFLTLDARCQTWDEVFNQKKTQKRYLLEQVAALQAYAGYVQKGYALASDGLGIIRSVSSGEMGLHEIFFSGLKTASAIITRNPKVGDILGFQQDITNAFRKIRPVDPLSSAYVGIVRVNLAKTCADDLWELALLLSSGRTEIEEKERLQRLESLHESMRDKASFARWFAAQSQSLELQKQLESLSAKQLRSLYENN